MKERMENIKHKYGFIIICAFVSLFLFIIGGVVKNNAEKKYDDAVNQYYGIKNKTSQVSVSLDKVERKVIPAEKVVSAKRMNMDGDTIYNFIGPAFNFSDADEYNANRQKLVDALGSEDPFIVEILQPYVEETIVIEKETDIDKEKTKFNATMSRDSFLMRVTDIDWDNDIYSYVISASVASKNMTGMAAASNILISCDVDGSGNISNLRVATCTK